MAHGDNDCAMRTDRFVLNDKARVKHVSNSITDPRGCRTCLLLHVSETRHYVTGSCVAYPFYVLTGREI